MKPVPKPDQASKPARPHLQMSSSSVLHAARSYHAAGISVIPVCSDGKSHKAKQAAVKWSPYQEARPSEKLIDGWWDPTKPHPFGIALICGAVSGGLELIDFDRDHERLFPAWEQLVEQQAPGLLSRVSIVDSPGGVHVWIRCVEQKTPGSQKLAYAVDAEGKRAVAVETRGEGGYGLAPGTPASCHPSEKLYLWRAGVPIHELQPISAEERDILLKAARGFDCHQRTPDAQLPPGEPLSPLSDYDLNGPPVEEIIGPHGWTECGGYGPVKFFRRPGKAVGTLSATWGFCRGADGAPLLYVFSSNALPLQAGESYGRARLHIELNCKSSWKEATRQIASWGYGTTSRPPARPAGEAVILPIAGPAATRPTPARSASSAADGPTRNRNGERIATAHQAGIGQQHNPSDAHQEDGKQAERAAGGSVTSRLIDEFYARGGVLRKDPRGACFIRFEVKGSSRCALLRSPEATLYLGALARGLDGGVIDKATIERAVFNLECDASIHAEERPLCLRVGEAGGLAYLDLCNDKRQVVELAPTGWTIRDKSPVDFRRTRGQKPLPLPKGGTHLNDFRRWFNLKDDSHWLYVASWLVWSLRPAGPYPLLVISGQQGSAKSTMARQLRSLIDPNASPLRDLPSKSHDLFLSAMHSHVLAFDNLDTIPPSLSNALCLLSTGGGSSAREHYSNDEEVVFDASRPVILTGIGQVATKADLLSRGLQVELTPIPKGEDRRECDLWPGWNAELPHLLGAVLDAHCAALARWDQTPASFVSRMRDFEAFVHAIGPHMGWSEADIVEAFEVNEQTAADTAVMADVVVAPLRRLLDQRGGMWKGSAEALLAELSKLVTPQILGQRSWPTHGNALSGRLASLAPALLHHGMAFEKGRELTRRRDRYVKVWDVAVCTDGD